MTIGISLGGKVDFDLGKITKEYNINTWIAVDGGYNHLIKAEITPEIIIGDMDSISVLPDNIPTLKYNPIKDFTDFDLAIKYVQEKYKSSQLIVVGVNDDDRLEHFIANLKLMNDNMTFITKFNVIKQYSTGFTIDLDTGEQFSIFAKTSLSKLNILNAKWELENYNLDINDALTISNESIGKPIEINFATGVAQVYTKNKLS